jgi:RNA processing factor Prp31
MMDKNLNTFCMRLKEAYGWHFPELGKLVSDNETYVKLVRFIGVGLLEPRFSF